MRNLDRTARALMGSMNNKGDIHDPHHPHFSSGYFHPFLFITLFLSFTLDVVRPCTTIRECYAALKLSKLIEARGGIEPPIKVLQTFALPLGYRAVGKLRAIRLACQFLGQRGPIHS